MKTRHPLLQRITTIACVLVGALVLVGTVSAFFMPGIEAALTLPPAYKVISVTPAARPTQPLQPMNTATSAPMGTVTAASMTPATVSLLAQDNFQRANQLYWGMASDGQAWGEDAQQSPSFSISGDVGQIANGHGVYNAIIGPMVTDAEIVFNSTLSHFGPSHLGVVLRWTDANNWYKAYIDGSQLILLKRVAGKISRLRSAAFTAQNGRSYSLRFRVAGSLLSARAGPTGRAEPTTWMVTATDTALTAGFGGLRPVIQNGAVATFTLLVEMAAREN
jgi:hypothetical protein